MTANGVVVGTYYTATGTGPRGFLYSPDTGVTLIDVPGAASTEVNGINDDGVSVGSYSDIHGRMYGFRRSVAGAYTTIEIGDHETVITGINRSDTLVGWYLDTPGDYSSIHGFVTKSGVTEVLDNPWRLPVTAPHGISDDGTVVGTYHDRPKIAPEANPVRGFVLQNRSWKKLDVPNADDTGPSGISSDGTIVGFATFADGERGFSIRNGRFALLDVLNVPYGISSRGVMVGFALAGQQVEAVIFPSARRSSPLFVETPNTTAKWGIGTGQRLAWRYEGAASHFRIDISRDGGASWRTIRVVSNAPGTSQSFYWTVTGPPTTSARLRVTAVEDPDATDTNDAPIRIAAPFIQVVRPVADTVVRRGAALKIFFQHNLGARRRVAVDVRDCAGDWRTITNAATTKGSDTSSFDWIDDLAATPCARVRVRAIDGIAATGESAAFVSTGEDVRTLRTTRVSVTAAGAQANGGSVQPSLSADGRFVAFWSEASNLVKGDTNRHPDVFVRDLQDGSIERVSVSSRGDQGNGASFGTSISADGRLVAFASLASNLVDGDTNASNGTNGLGGLDVFVHDRKTHWTTRVSLASNGAEANAPCFAPPAISADGRYVAFRCLAWNLVDDDRNGDTDVFVRDLLNDVTERASMSARGREGSFGGAVIIDGRLAISADGRFVAFGSLARDLVDDDTNNAEDLFVRDRLLGTTERVNVTSAGGQSALGTYGEPSFSADGRFIVFSSFAADLVPNDANGAYDVFVRDREARTTQRVSVADDGAEGSGESAIGTISADGRFVVFESLADNLSPNDRNLTRDVFVRDLKAQRTRRVSFSITRGDTDEASTGWANAISADGGVVAFASLATNMVRSDTNAAPDVFVIAVGTPH